MKRIALCLLADPEGGGSFQYAQVLVRALAESGLPRQAIKVWHGPAAWGGYLRDLGLEAEPLYRSFAQRKINGALRRLSGLLPAGPGAAAARRLLPSRSINAWRPDVILNPGQHCVTPLPGTRQLAAIHDLMHIYEPSFPEVNSWKEVLVRNQLYRGIAERCTDILVDSHIGERHVRDSYRTGQARIHVLPFAAPEELLRAKPAAPGLDLPEKFILYPAQFWEHKNHARLADALALLVRELPDIHCVLTGSRRYSGHKRFLERVERHGLHKHFTVTGYITTEELAWLYRRARGMVMPTCFGPTNIPPLEAMALGCPAAVSEIYAMPEQCGDAALYLRPDCADSIARVMRLLWTDDALCADLRAKGLRRAASWTNRHVAERFMRIVGEMLS